MYVEVDWGGGWGKLPYERDRMEIPVSSTPTPPTQGRGWGLHGFMFDGPGKSCLGLHTSKINLKCTIQNN